MKVTAVFFSLLVVGTLALPSLKYGDGKESLKKMTKYPKKYDKDIHEGYVKKKDKESESSYVSYDRDEEVVPLRVPSPLPGYIYVVGPHTEMVAPPRHSYSIYDAVPTDEIKPPSKEGSDTPYQGYVTVEAERSGVLRPPKLSSYADRTEGTSDVKDFSSGLLPPMPRIDASLPEGSSYLSLEAGRRESPYSNYDRENADKVEMSPPS